MGVGDAFYGRSHQLRKWLEGRGRAYALMIPKTTAVQYRGRRERAAQLGDAAVHARRRASRGRAWNSPRSAPDGMRRWLLVRRDAEDPEEPVYFLAFGPEGTSEEELVRVCNARWQIEECFAQAKGEVGLDHYEVRRWEAWHRHATLCLLAHAYLVVLRRAARREEGEKGGRRIWLDPAHGPRGAPAGARDGRSPRRGGRSGSAGRGGAGRTKRSPPAAMPRGAHSNGRARRPPRGTAA